MTTLTSIALAALMLMGAAQVGEQLATHGALAQVHTALSVR